MVTSPTTLRRLYILLYIFGTISLLVAVCTLFWIAYCILVGAEPLAALVLLPENTRIFALPALLISMLAGGAAWNKGAKLQQREKDLIHGR